MSDFDAWVNRANDLQGEVNELEAERDALLAALGKMFYAYSIDSGKDIVYRHAQDLFHNRDDVTSGALGWYMESGKHIHDDLETLERQRNGFAQQMLAAQGERDTLRAILSELLALPYIGLYPAGGWRCEFCKQPAPESGVASDYQHAPDCPIARARRLLKEANSNGK